jgi:hypothetical protein
MTMRKTLLVGVAAVVTATLSTAHARDAMLPADPLIGIWCQKVSGIWTSSDVYERGNNCAASGMLSVNRDNYVVNENTCTFHEVKRLPSNDGYLIRAECYREPHYWNEETEIRIIGKTLRYRNVAFTDAVEGGETTCAVVSSDIPDEGQGRFLNLRAGPGMQFTVKAKLVPGDKLEVDATKNEWKHVRNAARLSTDGWVRDKYVVSCNAVSDSTKPGRPAEPVPPAPQSVTPTSWWDKMHQAYLQYNYLIRYCQKQFSNDDMERAHAAVKAVEREAIAAKSGLSLDRVWQSASDNNDGTSKDRCPEMFRSLTGIS